MNKDKKGLSQIITTIVIIGIALVAVGIIWYVVNNVLKSQENIIKEESGNLFKTCAQANYSKISTDADEATCYNNNGAVRYVGGEKCCTASI